MHLGSAGRVGTGRSGDSVVGGRAPAEPRLVAGLRRLAVEFLDELATDEGAVEHACACLLAHLARERLARLNGATRERPVRVVEGDENDLRDRP
jgi:hypothetical protein